MPEERHVGKTAEKNTIGSILLSMAMLSSAGNLFNGSNEHTASQDPQRQSAEPQIQMAGFGLFPNGGLFRNRTRSYSTSTYTDKTTIDQSFLAVLNRLSDIDKDQNLRLSIVKNIIEDRQTRVVSMKGDDIYVDKDINLPRGTVTCRFHLRSQIEPKQTLDELKQIKSELTSARLTGLAAYMERLGKIQKLMTQLQKEGVTITTTLQGDVWVNNHFAVSERTCSVTFKPATAMNDEERQRVVISSRSSAEGTFHGVIGRVMEGRALGTMSAEASEGATRTVQTWKNVFEPAIKRSKP